LFPIERFRIGLILDPLQLITKHLTQRQREVCAAWFYDRTPQPDIATRFGISQQAVSRLIMRATSTLQRHGLDLERLRQAA
jgi:RNA polymerase sigma factor (sigma-70 family)